MASVLLIDDNEEITRLVKSLLESRGHDVTVALSGEEALERLSNGSIPDVILLDIIMPGMSGEEVLRHIKASKEFRDIPIHVFSVVSDREKVTRWLALGASGFVPKPFSVRQLEEAVALD